MGTRDRRSCEFIPIGLLEYTRALALQQEILITKQTNRNTPDRLLFLEHPPVFTLGRRGGRENLVVSESFLDKQKIKIVETDRGGNITYHGPGQAVVYPIIDLKKNKLSVPDFVSGLEEIMKRICLDFGVPADRDPRNHGLWVGDKKIGSVGISIKKGISIHGMALNVNPDLMPFSWINPCGLANQAMTSIAAETSWDSLDLNPKPTDSEDRLMDTVRECVEQYFADVFHFEVTRKNSNGT